MINYILREGNLLIYDEDLTNMGECKVLSQYYITGSIHIIITSKPLQRLRNWGEIFNTKHREFA